MGKLDYDLPIEGWRAFTWILRINNEHDYLIPLPSANSGAVPNELKLLGESVALTFTIQNQVLIKREYLSVSTEAASGQVETQPSEPADSSGQSYIQMLLQIRSRVPSQRASEGIQVGGRVVPYSTDPMVLELYAYRPNVEQLVKSCSVTMKQSTVDLGDFSLQLGRNESVVCIYVHKHEVIQSMNGLSFSSLFEFVDIKQIIADEAYQAHISLFNPHDGTQIYACNRVTNARIASRVSKLSLTYAIPPGFIISRGEVVVMNFVLTTFPDTGNSKVVQAFSKSWKGLVSVSLINGFSTIKIRCDVTADNRLSITTIDVEFLLPDAPLASEEPRRSIFRRYNPAAIERILQSLDSEISFLNSSNPYPTTMDFGDDDDDDEFSPAIRMSQFRMNMDEDD